MTIKLRSIRPASDAAPKVESVELLTSPMIRTKLLPPRLTRVPVRRGPLMRLLEAGATRALTCIKAPAGFGKTTLLTLWRDELLAKRQAVAWLMLDQDDNDEGRFVDYVIAAFVEALGTPVGGTAESGAERRLSATTRLTSLINWIDRFGQEVTLILDDYEKISSPVIHGLIEFLLIHIPRNLHVVIAGRIDPKLPVSALRARDQLVEIDADALRFDITDTHAFFADSVALELSADETQTIYDITEGWVVGLQIAALVLPRNTPSRNVFYPLPRHARALGEYLAENVLAQIAPDMVAFMLRTSLPDRLNGPLCAELTGFPDAAERLDWLVRHNMFVQPLDEEGEWFRYHGLFADFLRAQLKRTATEDIPSLHLKAAQWFAEHALWSEAVRHAIAAGGMALATQCLERCSMDELRASRMRNFLDWVRQVPPEAVREQPRLRIALVWALILTVQLDEAQAALEEIEAQVADHSFSEMDDLHGVLRVQHFLLLAARGETRPALELGQQIWAERFPQGGRPSRGFDWVDEMYLNVQMGMYRKAGLLAEARRIGEMFRLFPALGSRENLFQATHRATQLAALDMHEGNLPMAAQRLEEALVFCEAHAERRSAATSLVAAWLTQIYYEWDRLDDVEAQLANRLDVIDDICSVGAVQPAYMALIDTHIARGRLGLAHALLDRAERMAEVVGRLGFIGACIAKRQQLWLRDGRMVDAGRALQSLEALYVVAGESRQGSEQLRAILSLARARHHLAMRAFDAAVLGLADTLGHQVEETAETSLEWLQLHLLLAVAQHARGDLTAALDAIAPCMPLIERAAAFRSVLDAGPAVGPILAAYAATIARTPHSPNLVRLLQALNVVIEPAPANLVPPPVDSIDVQHFSRRELEILELVLQKRSNKQIASALFITAETVKWHLKNLYKKLGVSDRRLVAEKVRGLGKIQAPDA